MLPRPRILTLFVVLLAASLSLKLLTLPDARASGSAGDDAIREQMRGFLAREGFASQIEPGLVGLPAASGERDGCRVLLADVAPQGYHRDLIFSLAKPADTVAFLFRGEVYPDQPGWATWATRLISHLELAPAPASTGAGSNRVYAVLAVGSCAIEASHWAKQLDRPATPPAPLRG